MARPRSIQAHKRVLNTALKLFAESGVDATSIDAISETSGVSKATIYKHWPNKNALCLEVMAQLWGTDRTRPVFDSGDIRKDLIAALRHRPRAESSQLRARLMPHLLAYAARNPELGKAYRKSIFEPSRSALVELLDRAIRQGKLSRRLDRDLATAMLLGPMIYSHLLRRLRGRAPAPDLAKQIVNAFWKAYAVSK